MAKEGAADAPKAKTSRAKKAAPAEAPSEEASA
jgi:hypothetical protein